MINLEFKLTIKYIFKSGRKTIIFEEYFLMTLSIDLSKKINSSGSLFLGEISSEVLADYVAGPSHVMPTNGSARYSSSLSTRTFTKNIPVLSIDKEEFDKICEDGELLASLESLDAHKNALTVRKNFFTEE